MNLADIRKKAQKGEVKGAESLPVQIPVEAEPPPFPEWEMPEDEPEPLLPACAEPAAPAAPAAPEEASTLWLAEQLEQARKLALADETEGFDPLSVILRGRESAAFEVEESLKDEVDTASVELLCFKVASEEYAIDIMDIKEIMKPREVTEVPRVPSFVRGILSLRGNIIPVFDMRTRLGLSGNAPSERERVVVVKRGGGFCGVLVDEVVQVVRIAEAGIEPPPVVLEGIDREFVLGIGRVNGRMLILLDMEKVLDVGL